MWMSLRGRKTEAESAGIFQVYTRVPQVGVAQFHWLSGPVCGAKTGSLESTLRRPCTDREPRPITRFGSKFGIRVMLKDEEQVRSKLGAEESAPKIQVQQIYSRHVLEGWVRGSPAGSGCANLWTGHPDHCAETGDGRLAHPKSGEFKQNTSTPSPPIARPRKSPKQEGH